MREWSIIEGSQSLEVKLPTIWTVGNAEVKRGEEKKREDQRGERVRRKKMQMCEKVGKSRFTVFIPMICGSGGSKSRLAKAAGAEPSGQMRDEKLHAVLERSAFSSQNVVFFWKLRCSKSARHCGAKHIFKSKCTKHQDRTTFGSWELRCSKSARHCGGKHMSKSKCTKHTNVALCLAVKMSKKWTLLWREAHFQVNMVKAPDVWTTFWRSDVEKKHAVVAPGTFRIQKCKKMRVLTTFWRSDVFCVTGAGDCAPCQKRTKREGFVAVSITTFKTTTTIRYTTVYYTKRHSTTLRYTTPHYTTLHYTPLHYTTPHYITLH